MANLKESEAPQLKCANAPTDPTHAVRHNDPRLSDARAPLAHVHDAATEGVAGFMSAADKAKLNALPGTVYFLGPVATFNDLPTAGDPLNAVRMSASDGAFWRHVATTGTRAAQWQPPGTQSVTTMMIGSSARLSGIDGGLILEVQNTDGTWVEQERWVKDA